MAFLVVDVCKIFCGSASDLDLYTKVLHTMGDIVEIDSGTARGRSSIFNAIKLCIIVIWIKLHKLGFSGYRVVYFFLDDGNTLKYETKLWS